MATNYFQLLVGLHQEKGGKRYTAGDVIGPVEHDLVKMFGSNKFRRLNDDEVSQLQTYEPDTAEQPRKRVKAKRKSA